MEEARTNAGAALQFATRPVVVIWEVTQACDLACVHCRACARPERDAAELTTAEGKRLIDEVADLGAPVFVLTGGDPLKRGDILELIRYARSRGIRPALSPSATPLLTREAIMALKEAGIFRLAISLDGSTAAIHDGFRGVPGTYDRALEAIAQARACGMPVQINTTVSQRTFHDFDRLAKVVEEAGVVLWSVFFLVPTGRATLDQVLTAEQTEDLFARLHTLSKRVRFHIKTTEAPHYRRFLLQQRAAERAAAGREPVPLHVAQRAFHGINDAKGFVFVSHRGEVCPSGFLPLVAGNVRQEPLGEIYRESVLFQSLRDPECLQGKCRLCQYRHVCGGSRARAYNMTGNALAEEPTCLYVPGETEELVATAMAAD
jgi:AdoMet-dependent heme synthase